MRLLKDKIYLFKRTPVAFISIIFSLYLQLPKHPEISRKNNVKKIFKINSRSEKLCIIYATNIYCFLKCNEKSEGEKKKK